MSSAATTGCLPTFLGIGAMRSGTSWLFLELERIPGIALSRRKEVHFFDRSFERGVDWYRSFFPVDASGPVGEITPSYLADPAVPERIAATLPDARLIAILRHPVDRAFSEYTRSIRNEGTRVSFDEYMAANRHPFEAGLYGGQLARYLDWFPREQLGVWLLEEVTTDPRAALVEMARFVGADPDGVPHTRVPETVNASGHPRFPRIYRAGKRVRSFLVKHDLDGLTKKAMRMPLGKFLRSKRPAAALPALDEGERRRWYERFAEDLERLEGILGRELDAWTP